MIESKQPEPLEPVEWNMYGTATLKKGQEQSPIHIFADRIALGLGAESRKAMLLSAQGLLSACLEVAKINPAFRAGLIKVADDLRSTP